MTKLTSYVYRREADPFHIEKLYQSLEAGEEWYFNQIENDPRMILSESDKTVQILTSTGFDPDVAMTEANDLVQVQTDQSVLNYQGYMYNVNDFKNVEITGCVKMLASPSGVTNRRESSSSSLDISVRGARHQDDAHGGCEGTGYHAIINAIGKLTLQKELQHSATGVSATDVNPQLDMRERIDVYDRWIFFKFVVINTTSEQGDVSVVVELWLDDETDQRTGQCGNVWVKKLQILDDGTNWPIAGTTGCSGVLEGEQEDVYRKITWGGPIILLNWKDAEGTLGVLLQSLSVREITDIFNEITPLGPSAAVSLLPQAGAVGVVDPCDPAYIPTCPVGYTWDIVRRVCHRDTPSCPAGQKWDATLLRCVDDPVTHTCSTGFVWSDLYQKCIPVCGTGQHYDSQLDKCVDDQVTPPLTGQIYPTKQGGDTWSLAVDGVNSSRFSTSSNVSLSKNADDSYTANVTAGSSSPNYSMRLNIQAKTATSTRELNQVKLAQQGYMSSPGDWKNIEFEVYVNILSMNSEDQFDLYTRGGRHTDSNGGCEGTALKIDFFTSSGAVRVVKEIQHTDGYTYGAKQSNKIPSLMNKWVGLKQCSFNYTKPGTNEVVVVCELYCDPLADGHWQKIYAVTDDGHFCNSNAFCGGTKCQIISWGGPTATIRCDAMKKCMIKGIVLREIQPPSNITLPPSITSV